MALDDGNLISKEDLLGKINELIKIVSDQSDELTSQNIDAFLHKSLVNIRVYVYRTYGTTPYKYVYQEYSPDDGENYEQPELSEMIYPSIDRGYHLIDGENPLYNIDLSANSLIERFKLNSEDPILAEIKKQFGLYITHDVWTVPGHYVYEKKNKWRTEKKWIPDEYHDEYNIRAPGGEAHYYSEHDKQYLYKRWWGNKQLVTTYISEGKGYTVLADYISNLDALAGGKSLRELLINHGYLNAYFNDVPGASISIDDAAVPKIDNTLEDSSMNSVFRALLHAFANVRMVSFQKQFNNNGNWQNYGGKIDLPIRVRNLKSAPDTNVDALLSQFNEDQQLVDNNAVLDKLNEVYEIWKNLPKQEIYLRWCHSSCHGSRGRWW